MTTDERTVAAFELRDLGVDHAQYFQGAGVAFTQWDEVFVGVGDTAREAANDAMNNAYDSGLTLGELLLTADEQILALDAERSAHAECPTCCDDSDNCEHENAAEDECELQHYAALYVRYA